MNIDGFGIMCKIDVVDKWLSDERGIFYFEFFLFCVLVVCELNVFVWFLFVFVIMC